MQIHTPTSHLSHRALTGRVCGHVVDLLPVGGIIVVVVREAIIIAALLLVSLLLLVG